MKPEEEHIAKLLKKSLPTNRQEDEAEKRVFYRLLLAQAETPAASMPSVEEDHDEDHLYRESRPRFPMAVAFAAAASFVLIAFLAGSFWKAPENLDRTQTERASSPDGRTLVLSDGSLVEMRSQSELQVEHAADGLRLHLNEGSIIVTAAKQRAGHLHVQTKGAVISVVGTVFIVTVELAGSRVGIFEGVVSVRNGAISEKLLPGQHLATSSAMAPVSLEAQVSWSRNAARYLALLQQPVPPAQLQSIAPAPVAPQSQPAAADSLFVTGMGNRPARREAPTTETERLMEQALRSRELIADLSFAAETNYFQMNKAEYFVPVTLKIPGAQLAGSESAKRVSFDILVLVMDDYGTVIQNLRDTVDEGLADATAKEVSTRQITYETGFTLLPGRYSIKLLVHDGVTGRIGTYQMAVSIPNLAREGPRLPISSVVLSSELINPDKQPPTPNPLIIEGKKLIPSVTRTFSNRRDLIVFFQAYEENATSTVPLNAFVTLYRGETKVLETAPVTVKDDVGGKLRTFPFRLSVPLQNLPAGAYDCQVTVVDPATQKTALWRSSINVVNLQ